MATSSFDRLSSKVDASGNLSTNWQPYSKFRVQTLGGNIVQGQINKIRVAEVLFPYAIPTVINSTGDPTLGGGVGLGQPSQQSADNAVLQWSYIAILPNPSHTVVEDAGGVYLQTGYYTGTELAAIINAELESQKPLGYPVGGFTVTYDTNTNSIVARNNTVWNDASENYLYNFNLLYNRNSISPMNQPNALWTLGLRDLFTQYPPIPHDSVLPPTVPPTLNLTPTLVPVGYPNAAPYPVFPVGYAPNIMVASTYTGLYTQYIDVCSPSLCQAQYVRDGNTNQAIIRRDIIARIYISSEVSTPLTNPAGSRPFLIHRQFKNAKVMKWTAERSIDNIDLVLYDQFGNQLPIIPPTLSEAENPNDVNTGVILQSQPSDYAITFLVDEHDETTEHNVGYTA